MGLQKLQRNHVLLYQMLINVDVSGLEVVCAAFLSQDPVLIQELRDGVDIHTANQTAFNLPNRLIAKVLKFRILYGGTEFGFAKDPDFTSVSTSKEYWAKAIEAYYDKYKGIRIWHDKLLKEVVLTGRLESPTGRYFPFEPTQGRNGLEWPVMSIKNYPVQGLGADLVMIARITLANRMKQGSFKGKLVSSVHDSIVIDCPDDEVEALKALTLASINDVPANFKRLYGIDFNLKLNAEVVVGVNMKEMS